MGVLYLIAGSVLLWFGAETFVRCSAALALRMGLTPLAVGLTVVAFGTSAPELGVSLESTLKGLGDVATGNVVGSNIANVGLILGLAALVRPIDIRASLLRLDVPVVILASLVVTLLFLDGTLSRLAGAGLLASLLVYVTWQLGKARQEKDAQAPHFGEQAVKRPLVILIPLVLTGLAMLAMGSHAFVEGAQSLAAQLGVSQALIGLTIVAVGTSLPEMATSVVAAARGEGDIAVGNVVGSNAFNLLGILGIASLARPITRGDVTLVDFGVMIAFALLLVPLMRTGLRISRFEGGLLVAGYLGYLAWLLP